VEESPEAIGQILATGPAASHRPLNALFRTPLLKIKRLDFKIKRLALR